MFRTCLKRKKLFILDDAVNVNECLKQVKLVQWLGKVSNIGMWADKFIKMKRLHFSHKKNNHSGSSISCPENYYVNYIKIMQL